MKHASIWGSVVLAVAGVAAAQAQAPAPAPAPAADVKASVDFASLDKNSDGRIASGEAQSTADLQKDFATLDVNADGQLSQAEYAKWTRASKSKDAMPIAPKSTDSTQPSESESK